MVGSGSPTFAVWSYVIAKMQPDKEVGAQVELNPKLLAFILGEKEDVVEKVIQKMCSPDAKSRTPDEQGKRLIRLGQFSYRVVNGVKYLGIRDLESKRAADRDRKAKSRENKPKKSAPDPNAEAYEKAFKNGASDEQLDKIVTESLPTQCQDGIQSIEVVKKEFNDWGHVTKDNLNKVTCCHCGKPFSECKCPAVVELKQAVADQFPDTGKVMVPDGTEPERSIRDVQLPVMCERCEQPGHIGENCPEMMHMANGKWVKD